MQTMRLFLAFRLALVFVSAPAHGVTRLAVIAEPGEAEQLAALIQPSVAEIPDTQWVDREQFATVLAEQKLGTYFSADAPGQRVKLGKLLKADVLVFLQVTKTEKPCIEVVGSESKQGIRLAMQSVSVADPADTKVKAISKIIKDLIARSQQPVKVLIAVPPLACNDLTAEFSRDGTAYARLIEHMLLDRKEILVVELAEAKAIAREIAVGGVATLDRQLPLYLFGEYRNTLEKDKRHLKVKLRLNRGNAELGVAEEANISTADLAATLIKLTDNLVSKHAGQSPEKFDPDTESRLLADRGKQFERLGQLEEALSLYDASLLLKDRMDVHYSVASTICSLYYRDENRKFRQEDDVETRRSKNAQTFKEDSVILHEGQRHIETFMTNSRILWSEHVLLRFYASVFPPDEVVDMFERALRAKNERKVEDEMFRFMFEINWVSLPLAQRQVLFVKVANLAPSQKMADENISYFMSYCFRGPKKDEPLLRQSSSEALKELETSTNPYTRAAAIAIIKRNAAGTKFAPFPPPPVKLPSPANPDYILHGFPQFEFGFAQYYHDAIPIGEKADLIWSSGNGQPYAVFAIMGQRRNGRVLGHMPGLSRPIFDGKYIWIAAAAGDGPAILIIDAETEKTWKLTPADGLPNEEIVVFSGSALEPGKVCAAASISHDNNSRTWVGLLTFELGAGAKCKIIHEARLKSSPDKSQKKFVAFWPRHSMVLQNLPGKKRAVLFWNQYDHYTVIFPNPQSVNTGENTIFEFDEDMSKAVGYSQPWASGDHSKLIYINTVQKDAQKFGIYSFTPGEKKPKLIQGGVPDGTLAVTEAGTYLFTTKKELWIADSPEGKFDHFAMKEDIGSNIQSRRGEISLSSLNGIVIYGKRCEDKKGNLLPWKKPVVSQEKPGQK